MQYDKNPGNPNFHGVEGCVSGSILVWVEMGPFTRVGRHGEAAFELVDYLEFSFIESLVARNITLPNKANANASDCN